MLRRNLRANSPVILMSASLTRESARSTWHARFDNRTQPKAAAGKLIVKASDDDTTELMLYDEVGFWGVTAKQFAEALATVTTPKIRLRINSPGGDVFEGYAIYNALKQHRASVETVIDGLAASAASFIALAGDKVSMGNPSMMMIHRAWTVAMGNARDMAEVAATLEKVDGQIAAIYATKSGREAGEMLDLMTAETWLTAEEAEELDLIDEVIDPDEDNQDDPNEVGDKTARAHAARMRAARLVALGVK